MPSLLQRHLAGFDRVLLLDGPTPIQRLERLEKALGADGGGVRIFVKRDDLMGLGGGGNKLRKLEFLLGEAVARGCDTFITTGGVQSNHARLSAAASARMGLTCELVLTRVVPRDDEDYRRNGNVVLDHLFGAVVHEHAGDVDALGVAQSRATALRRAGRRPYVVGSGGSSPIGCLGYAACSGEILAQEEALGIDFARIVLPNGSSGTHAGLVAGLVAAGQAPTRVLSFAVLRSEAETRERTIGLARETLGRLLADPTLDEAGIDVDGNQLGDGYGVPTSAMLETVRLVARSEGLLLDPVYGGKAFAGLLAMIRDGRLRPDDAVLFVMTGGTPGLFAYRTAFEAG